MNQDSELETANQHGPTTPSMLEFAGSVIGVIVLMGVLVTLMYGATYEMMDTGDASIEQTSGVIESVSAEGGQSFSVTFTSNLAEGGPTELYIIGPDGTIMAQTDLAPGVRVADFTGDAIMMPPFEHAPGRYQIVATHGNNVHGRATIVIERRAGLLPFVPLERLFGVGAVIGVLVLGGVIGGIIRAD